MIGVGLLALSGAVPLTPRRRVGVSALAATLAAAIVAWHYGWSDWPPLAFFTHAGAIGAILWALAARLLRSARATSSDRPMLQHSPDAFERVALLCGVAAFVLLAFEITLVVLLRTGLWSTPGRLYETSSAGLIDLTGLLVALCLALPRTYLVTPLLWLLTTTVAWSACMIPAGLASKWIVTSWPRWMPSTLWMYVGASLILFSFVTAQGMLRQHRRKRAWPDRLNQLCEPHASWPGFRASAAAIAMGLLPLGAYHADSFLVMPCAALTGGAALRLAHRKWNPNFADVGMALVTLAVVSFFVACVPESVGGPELTTRMPLLLAATMIGLAVMIFIWQWLPNVWDQQLRDGVPWTTTGRMIPLARRIGIITASFGALAGSQLAFWPEIARTQDHSPARIIAGLSAYAIMIGSMLIATRMSRRRSLAGIVLLSLALLGAYVAIRFPDVPLKYRAIEHWPIAVALAAPVGLALSRWVRNGQWGMFDSVLEFSAGVVLPGIAIGGAVAASIDPVATLVGKLIYYDAALLRTGVSAVLAAHYGLHARLARRRALWIPAAGLALVAVINLAVSR